MSDTPRTDVAVAETVTHTGGEYVKSSFARQLEREVAELRACLREFTDTSRSYLEHFDHDDLAVLERARAALNKG